MKRKRLLSVLVSAVVVIGVAVPLQANYTQYKPYDAVEDAIIDFDPFSTKHWVIVEPCHASRQPGCCMPCDWSVFPALGWRP